MSIRPAALMMLACVAVAGWFGSYVGAEPIKPAAARIDTPTRSSDVAAPLSVRFAGDSSDETPDFQKHVVPLLGRLGCNGRACHGSFQGRGGFQLSLFGYDFKADHTALLDEATGRVDVDDIDESLILAKPLDADLHEGGKRFDEGSWQHHVLRRWVETGAIYANDEPQTLNRLEVIPSEVRFTGEQETLSVKAIAHWQDGSSEEVTELCRFSSNDDSIAAINDEGLLAAGQTGDTHIVVYYDNAVVPVPVMRAVGPTPLSPSKYDHPIDQLVAQKLDKLGIQPSGICTDEEFIRRSSLDITGILPSADTVREFLDDASPNKREVLIDELLDSPGYAAWWATRLSDWTGNSEEQLNNALPIRNVASQLWYEWLRKRLAENVPYDELIEGIVTANNRQPGEDYRQFCESMTKACAPGGESEFAGRDGMPLYWARRNFQKPEERAIGFAYSFLGVRIECAQCHKHPFDQWSKDDFEQFSKLFTPIRVNANQVAPDGKATREELMATITDGKKLDNGALRKAVYEAARSGEIVPFGELLVNTRGLSDRAEKARARAKKKGTKVPPLNIPSGKILGQGEPLLLDTDPRIALMDWLRSPENPYFAKAIVNRVWSNYFGIGIVDPSDDMNLANPPSNAPLLDELAKQFIANDFDLRWLNRTIATSQTYQRSSATNATNVRDQRNFSRHVPRRLPAEVVYDSVVLATGSDKQAEQLRSELDDMAIADGKPRQQNKQDFALEVFGQSIRESNCDCDRSDSPSLLQSIYLRNDSDMYRRLADKDGWVNQACKSLGVAGPAQKVDPKQALVLRRALEQQKQLIAHIKLFANQPNQKRVKFAAQLRGEHDRLTKKFKQYKLPIPPLDDLMADPDSWKPLDANDQVNGPSTLTVDQLVEEAYLRTLSRFPDSDETQISVDFIKESEIPSNGLQSLLWALVNTKEFIISH
ncbi:hypothetical protein Poly51_21200 [Rubripirellula tenax]|uniref:BIG2 domain-containing protein n=1 Tax=Rubripirellula tenax TaxID=2528015 RepID=A0A5C6FF15_9BACT|nr:DUF1549 and DUF1553 domain-containing protein [Rubripirellula tenax]TWU59332.1 hypothetical protein Poly51_21200 [Rubripirellula tenax]